MDIDDEPPMLVEAGGQTDAPENITADMEDLNVSRVPITIITGKSLSSISFWSSSFCVSSCVLSGNVS